MSQQTPASILPGPAFLQLPAQTPPRGVIPNFANPENIGPTLVIVGAILLTLVIIALAVRAYAKLHIVRKASWDDLTISFSAIGAVIWIGDILKDRFIIPGYAVLVLNGPTLWITKLTFFLLYLQIFRPMRWLRLCIYLGFTLSTIFYWGLSITLIVLASPRSGQTWAEADASGSNVEIESKINIAIATGGLLIDVWLFVLPLVAINKLQLHTARKIGLAVMFATGLLAVAASAVSIYFRWKLEHTGDKTWTGLDVELLYLIEVDAGIITACMPSIAKMLRHHLPPWETLKSRLSLNTFLGPRGSSMRDLVAKHSQPTNGEEMKYYGKERLDSNGPNSAASIELESLRSVDTH